MAEFPRLLLVWLALLAMLGLTVGASLLPIGPALPLVSYGLAASKTVLVFWYFMDMRSEPGLARLAASAGFVWLMLLLTMVGADVATR